MNPFIAARVKQQGGPLTLKNLKTRIGRAHSAVIRNTLDKKSYGDLFKASSRISLRSIVATGSASVAPYGVCILALDVRI